MSGFAIYRKSIATWAVQKYFASQNIDIQFQVDSMGFSELHLSHILVDKTLKLEKLHLGLSSDWLLPNQVESVIIEAGNLDLEALLKLKNHFMALESDSQQTQSAAPIKTFCETLKPLSLAIQVKSLTLKKQQHPFSFELSTKAKEASFAGFVDASLKGVQIKNKLTFAQAKLKSSFSFICDESAQKAKVQLSQLESHIEQLNFIQEKPIKVLKAQLATTLSEFQISDHNGVDVDLPFSLSFYIKKDKTPFVLETAKLQLRGKLQGWQASHFNLELKGESLSVKKPVAFDIKQMDLSLLDQQKEFFPLTGKYKVKGLDYYGVNGKSLVKGLFGQGDLKLTENIYTSKLQLKSDSKNIDFNRVLFEYFPLSNRLSFNFLGKKNFIQLNDKLANLVPWLEPYKVKGQGRFLLQGPLEMGQGAKRGDFKILTEQVDLESEHGRVDNLKLKHNILKLSSLSSAKNQVIQIKELIYGPTLKDLVVQYQVIGPRQIKVSLLSLIFDGVGLKSKSFTFDAQNKRLKNFDGKISQLPLEKLLKLPLGDSVTASGMLNGNLAIEYVGKKPLFKGHLTAQSKGFIRYRKPGAAAFDPNAISGNPMTILENYLYDFYYESLHVDFESDQNYDLKMTLSALGRNPQYLQGKPLKLNVNLDQNLLAGFKALMLTYDLPGRLKDKIEKLGNK